MPREKDGLRPNVGLSGVPKRYGKEPRDSQIHGKFGPSFGVRWLSRMSVRATLAPDFSERTRGTAADRTWVCQRLQRNSKLGARLLACPDFWGRVRSLVEKLRGSH